MAQMGITAQRTRTWNWSNRPLLESKKGWGLACGSLPAAARARDGAPCPQPRPVVVGGYATAAANAA